MTAPRLIPAAWLSPVKMRAIVAHWSAGGHKAGSADTEHYHIMVQGDGSLVRGDHSIADNVNTGDDDYAAHTRGFNTGVIGVAMCCMLDAIESPFKAGPYPMTRVQFDVHAQVTAELCKTYGIPVTNKTTLSHAEVQGNLGIQQNGKWDFTRLAFDPSFVGAKTCGDHWRAAVSAALAKL